MTVVQVPDPATVLVFRTGFDGHSDLVAMGPRTRGGYHTPIEVPVCVRMRLPPGRARAVLGVPAHELTDRSVRVADLWGDEGRRLIADLAALGDDAGSVLAHLNSLAILAGPAAPADRSGPSSALTTAIRELSRPGANLTETARRAGVSERRLRTLFARDVGLSPKHFARISRLRRVLAQAGRGPWAAVADDAGFFDQAHMISDFRSLMGVSPHAYVSGRLPAATPCS
jgi:AraC-like DNA-binding protein